MRETIPHEEIKSAFSEIYNKFYLKHRLPSGQKRTDEEWENLITDVSFLRKKYDSVLVTTIINALLDEFEYQDKLERNNK